MQTFSVVILMEDFLAQQYNYTTILNFQFSAVGDIHIGSQF